MQITGFDAPYTIQARQVLAVDLHFRLMKLATHDLRWFVQMLGPDGIPVAMLDTGPLDGYTGFTGLPVGEELTEKAGLALPADLPAGDYRLIAGLYNPSVEGSPRLRSEAGGGCVDVVQLASAVIWPRINERQPCSAGVFPVPID